ncbi:hypothetical protein DUNSADRAFT_10192 [Dunaliella salina]|uniref:HMG box domain-containing protein n=1 Tax=Dunaliella salina TaxID=3046 RepID=A0ABQ7GFX5_DUNSA|nr:hypothetical protein DUNSADRAFT_10192 [Dunaliella salina]|eukprot:KAF5833505.1 hypothetical protein DUNSADRAFT_10192 [Dunaliella salina]
MLQIVASSLGGSARQQALCIAARQLVQPVVWPQQQQQTASFASDDGEPKRVTAYNLFVKSEWPRFKEKGVASVAEASGELSRLYKQLPAERHAALKKEADELSGRSERPEKVKSPAKYSGYTLYVKDAMPKLKARHQPGTPFSAQGAMKELGAAWKTMPEDIKSQWKERAEEYKAGLHQ